MNDLLPLNNNYNQPIPEEKTKEELELISKLQKKKNKIRKELKEKGILPKGAVNEYDNYEYFSEAQYKELFTDLFSKHGIELYITEIDYGTFEGTDKQPFGRTVTLGCKLIDIDTGYSETSNHTGEGLDRGDKAGYKATTGALKRFLSSTFLVATQDDPEREDEVKPMTRTEKYQKKSQGKTTNKITPKQREMIVNIFSKEVDKLKEILTKDYKVKKVDELSIIQADEIIKKWKGNVEWMN